MLAKDISVLSVRVGPCYCDCSDLKMCEIQIPNRIELSYTYDFFSFRSSHQYVVHCSCGVDWLHVMKS